MSSTQSIPATTISGGLALRVRFWLSAAALWALLYYVVGPLGYPIGVDRPLVLTGSFVGAVALSVVVIAAAAAMRALAGFSPSRTLMALCVALAVWNLPRGTIDDWLLLHNVVVGPATAGPYLRLFPDYVFLGLLFAAAACAAGVLREIAPVTPNSGASSAVRPGDRQGWLALLTTAALAAALLTVLNGPFAGATLRGQVYFAALVSFYAAVFAAQRLLGAQRSLWYWPAPLLVGLGGLAWAAMRPGVGGVYAHLNNIPASGLVRAMPVEMMAVGLAGVLLALRGAAPAPSDRA